MTDYTREPATESDEERDARFAPECDRIWGEGNWIRCSTCPHDDNDREVYHHKDAHGGVTDYTREPGP